MGNPGSGGPTPKALAKKERKQQAREARKVELRRQHRAMSLKRIGAWSGLVVAIAVALFFVLRTSGGGVSFSGDRNKVDAFSLPELQGSGTVSYASLRDRPLVLNFFASWCPFCISEMPGFENVHKALGSRVEFLGVSQSDAKQASINLMRQTAITYPTAIDRDGVLFHSFGGNAMPVTVFIRPGGQIAEVHTGPLDETGLKSLITQYFGVQ